MASRVITLVPLDRACEFEEWDGMKMGTCGRKGVASSSRKSLCIEHARYAYEGVVRDSVGREMAAGPARQAFDRYILEVTSGG